MALAAAGGFAFVAGGVLIGATGGAERIADDLVAAGAGAVASVIAFARALRPGAEPRLPILLLAAAIAANAAGVLVWALLYHSDPAPTFPGAAAPLWLPLGLAAIYAVVSDAHRTSGPVTPVALLDGLIAALAAAATAAVVTLAPADSAREEVLAENVMRALLPAVQIALVAAVVLAASMAGWRPSSRLGARAVAATLLLAVSALSTHEVVDAERPLNPGINGALAVALLILGCSTWLPDRRSSASERTVPRAALVIGGFGMVALAISVVGRFTVLPETALWIAMAALLSALVRSAVAVRDSMSLTAVRRQAERDELTGLHNRRKLMRMLDEDIAVPRAEGTGTAVLLIDLDGFKEVNDSLGHHIGDELLRVVAWRLRGVVGDDGSVARLGGDEFCVLLGEATRRRAQAMGVRVLGALERPIELDGLYVDIAASMGIALHPEHGDTATELLQRADVAMYLAKAEGGAGHAVYAREADGTSRKRLALIGELRDAIDTGQIEVHFQPRHRLSDGHIIGAEALVRWRHPELGLLPPSEFVPGAERSSLITPLTARVLDLALAECRRWMDAGRPIPVAVNLSVRHLHDPLIVEGVRSALDRAGVPSALLELEVTETMLMANPARARAALRGLADLGVRIAIDDFGVGHSSLAYLTTLPVAIVKIDRCFVRSGIMSLRDAAVVASVVDLGRRLGMTVVAEGVENASTASWLRDLGCHEAQGFHFHRPLPASAMRDALARDALPPAPGPVCLAASPVHRCAYAGSPGATTAGCGTLTVVND